jgi:glutaminyl-tRNA synthetase|tara:strand:- start:65 stop:2209 length:2145 start_codon:yes stop_codon:yes gene_type:complete|mmetsp:Transcript_9739/g.44328  ORF Transcript_9739/g.44328 Transcript_9739/m.44328 type:complete len:715 (-) Transcript_9739:1004-3148(-)
MLEVSMSAGKKAKANFEKTAKKKPDPAGLAIGKEAQAALVQKDYSKAKELFENARNICEASAVRATKAAKSVRKTNSGGENLSAVIQCSATLQDDADREIILPPPGSEGHLFAKHKANLPPFAQNYAINTSARMAEHLSITGGKWQTRFPPEPNGYLHIGHAKAMHFDFGVASKFGGNTYLRFDDTNPTAEKQEYIDSIISSVSWLGHRPFKVTYSSDYFCQLHELAVKLIKIGKAYVCHQAKAEVAASRQLLKGFQLHCARNNIFRQDAPLPSGAESPYRHRSVEENLRLFEEMSKGVWEEGSCSLRLKGDLRSDITSMWDLTAYRIKFQEHPHSMDAYCIYPTYDYTHCLVDSIENVTHSLCTLEFETRQAPNGPYYWLLHTLDMYKPVTWEFSRCNITFNVLSKRKLNILVTQGYVSGWDDPRLLTLEGLRRRGYTPTAINRFCLELGVTRNDNTQHLEKLERCIREELDDDADRRFAVLNPLPITITNHPGGSLPVECPSHPKFLGRGTRVLNFTSTVFIEHEDFRAVDDPTFYGLAPGKTVRLLFGYNITCIGLQKDAAGAIVSLEATYDLDSLGSKPPKGTLHWAGSDFIPGEVRVYDKLFSVEVPGKRLMPGIENDEIVDQLEDGGVDWLSQLNPRSLVVHQKALLEPLILDVAGAALTSRFQLQRLGYFTIDKDSNVQKPVLNRIVTLKESKELVALKNTDSKQFR